MTDEQIIVRSQHPAEWIAALPVLVGYELDNRSTLTFTADDGRLVCVAAIPHEAGRGQIGAVLAAQAEALVGEGVVSTWSTVHGQDPTEAWIRTQVLAEAVADCGLPRPGQHDQFAAAGDVAWPVIELSGIPDVVWDLRDHVAVRDRLELLLGTPARSRDTVGLDLAPAASELRDSIAEALPRAAADPQAVDDRSGWRLAAATAALGRLSDPQPWTGEHAARTLLALSDNRVMGFLLSHTMDAGSHSVLTPDSGMLGDLVRAAPPGLVAGPATLLAATLAHHGLNSARARAAAAISAADRPDATAAVVLLAALERGDQPREVLADIVAQMPELNHDAPPVFTAGNGHWPDPMASPAETSPEPAADPLTGPAAKDQPKPPSGPTR